MIERELGGLRTEIRDGIARIDARFDIQAARLDAGFPWSSSVDAWADKVDAALEAHDREIADLRERLTRLEKKSA